MVAIFSGGRWVLDVITKWNSNLVFHLLVMVNPELPETSVPFKKFGFLFELQML